jgi:hypothetical protein
MIGSTAASLASSQLRLLHQPPTVHRYQGCTLWVQQQGWRGQERRGQGQGRVGKPQLASNPLSWNVVDQHVVCCGPLKAYRSHSVVRRHVVPAAAPAAGAGSPGAADEPCVAHEHQYPQHRGMHQYVGRVLMRMRMRVTGQVPARTTGQGRAGQGTWAAWQVPASACSSSTSAQST